ncbi:MAG TPA: threonine synthase [Candidatus Acidoferrales bacterium]|nr:threonine synthase [Candidatus Acidoferrales bacterium]
MTWTISGPGLDLNIRYFRCSLCNATYAPDEVRYVCPKHGDKGLLDVVYDYGKINAQTSPNDVMGSHDFSVWRYWDLLPIARRSSVPQLRVGWTPLYSAKRLANSLGLTDLWLKDDGLNPTGSLKDRASTVVVAKAKELGVEVITAASSGNAGAALAGMAASAHMPAVVFAPHTAPQAKVAQLLIYGARVLLVKGTYDQAFDLSLAATKEFGWYSRNTGYNPFTVEGKKTASLEICEQLTQLRRPAHRKTWSAPDRIFVAVGDGNIITGIWKGLRDLSALGWIEKMPKLMGVEAEGAAACYNAWKAGTEIITPVDAHTISDSISVGLPRDGTRAVRAVRETNGAYITVSDDEVLASMRQLAREEGVFAEPAGATGHAGLVKAVRENIVRRDERIVVVVTGNGLKDVSSAMKAAGKATLIEPTLDAVRKEMG